MLAPLEFTFESSFYPIPVILKLHDGEQYILRFLIFDDIKQVSDNTVRIQSL